MFYKGFKISVQSKGKITVQKQGGLGKKGVEKNRGVGYDPQNNYVFRYSLSS